jgi:DNA-binding transcriptional LysR family regulator
MDLRHARTFVTVAELGTVSKAALRLRIAQPALSRQISALEQELGLKLFDRVGRGLVLTGEGEQLLSDCRGLLSYADTVGERAQLLRRGDTGVLKVAASPQFIEGAISNFLRRYAESFPNVKVKLIEAIGWSDIRGLLERGEIHLGQNLAHAVQPDDGRFASHPLEPVEQLAACHPTLTLGKGAIEIDRLATHPLLLLDTGYIFRRTFDAACRLAGLEPNIMFESRTPHTLLAMAESGHGVAIIPSTLRTHRYALRIVGVTYRGKALREPLAVFWDKRRPLPRYATAFCQMLAAHVREVFPITRPSEPRIGDVGKRATKRRTREHSEP